MHAFGSSLCFSECPRICFAANQSSQGRAPGEVESFLPEGGELPRDVAQNTAGLREVRCVFVLVIGQTHGLTGMSVPKPFSGPVQHSFSLEFLQSAIDPHCRDTFLPCAVHAANKHLTPHSLNVKFREYARIW